jgi:hypothetical protein
MHDPRTELEQARQAMPEGEVREAAQETLEEGAVVKLPRPGRPRVDDIQHWLDLCG